MKTFITLTATVFLSLTMNVKAADRAGEIINDKPVSKVSVAPFVWGSPEESEPVELKNVKAKYANVPVSPFYFGDANENPPAELVNEMQIPPAPFVWGNPDEDAPVIE